WWFGISPLSSLALRRVPSSALNPFFFTSPSTTKLLPEITPADCLHESLGDSHLKFAKVLQKRILVGEAMSMAISLCEFNRSMSGARQRASHQSKFPKLNINAAFEQKNDMPK
ncbi:hypothetical protein LINGRAHAP2_LOCUS9647, partial [Linum grandiflorum]